MQDKDADGFITKEELGQDYDTYCGQDEGRRVYSYRCSNTSWKPSFRQGYQVPVPHLPIWVIFEYLNSLGPRSKATKWLIVSYIVMLGPSVTSVIYVL